MHTLRPNGRRRFTHFPHLGRPPCRLGNSQPAKNTSPPFYVRSAVFLTPSLNPIPTFFLLRRQSPPPFYAFSASNNSSKRETPQHLCHGHSPKPHSAPSAMRSLPHSSRFYTQFTPKVNAFSPTKSPSTKPALYRRYSAYQTNRRSFHTIIFFGSFFIIRFIFLFEFFFFLILNTSALLCYFILQHFNITICIL